MVPIIQDVPDELKQNIPDNKAMDRSSMFPLLKMSRKAKQKSKKKYGLKNLLAIAAEKH